MEIGSFYSSPSSPDGLSVLCKFCNNSSSWNAQFTREENPEDDRDVIYYHKTGASKGEVVSRSIKYINNEAHQWCTYRKHWSPRYLFGSSHVTSRQCKTCRSEKPKSRSQRMQYLKRYGISEDEYRQMWNSQEGACAICGKDLSLLDPRHRHIDHEHSTGRVRGILCSRCNRGLGFFEDNPDSLATAARYLSSTPLE